MSITALNGTASAHVDHCCGFRTPDAGGVKASAILIRLAEALINLRRTTACSVRLDNVLRCGP
ncbi:MAG: hypothetical protein U5L03_15960 [Burkholderiaceae bacterium]|nr:hypothetical protein [Burkholderiaceae bacterium]